MKAIRSVARILHLVVKYGGFIMAIVAGIKTTLSELEKDGLIEQKSDQ